MISSKSALLLSGLITLLFFLNLQIFSTESRDLQSLKIARAIDGDTLELEDGRSIRLLNVNSPESNFENSNLSLIYLSSFSNKTASFDFISLDKYGRILARIYNPHYLNLDLVSQGLSSKFLVSDSELDIFSEAEKSAISSGLGIWKHSKYYGCLSSSIDPEEEIVVLRNICNSNLKDLLIKDESRKTLSISLPPNSKIIISSYPGFSNSTNYFWNSSTNIWNNDRDTLYVFDSQLNLVHADSYGY